MKPYLVDIPVALVFFARPDVLKITFSAIKSARPSKLFLIQDGARHGKEDDLQNIKLCREIVANIDWDCQTYTNYSDVNLGCGKRVFTGISFAFQYVDRLIIIEDDSVPNISFFKFCAEILEKYKLDERIDMISGMNHLDIYTDAIYDYIFAKTGAICAWATWKRVWDTVDYEMKYLNNPEAKRLIINLHGKELFDKGLEMKRKLNSGCKLSSWSYQRGLNMFLQSRLIVVPKYNLVSNIGLTENSANSTKSLKLLPRALRRIYFMKTHEMIFPLRHPNYIIEDISFKRKVDRLMAFGHPLINIYRKCESIIYRILSGNISSLIDSFKRRFAL